MTELFRNVKFTPDDSHYPLQGEVYYSLFNQYIAFSVEENGTLDYVKICADYLNVLDESVIDKLCVASIRYRDDFCYAVGEDVTELAHPHEILAYIKPKSLLIPDPNNDNEPVIHLELDCDWEEEHGMEWIIRDSSVLYVGAFEYENPWREDFEADDCNYNYASTRNNPPISYEILRRLFEILDNLGMEDGCNHQFTATEWFLMDNEVRLESIIAWLNKHGAQCDCEIMRNIVPEWKSIVGYVSSR